MFSCLRSARALEEENVRFRAVNHVVFPTDGLLDADLAPLVLFHQTGARDVVLEFAGEDDVAVLIALSIEIFLGVDDLGLELEDFAASLFLLHGIGDGEEIGTLLLLSHFLGEVLKRKRKNDYFCLGFFVVQKNTFI